MSQLDCIVSRASDACSAAAAHIDHVIVSHRLHHQRRLVRWEELVRLGLEEQPVRPDLRDLPNHRVLGRELENDHEAFHRQSFGHWC
jgi:hypothetical protein